MVHCPERKIKLKNRKSAEVSAPASPIKAPVTLKQKKIKPKERFVCVKAQRVFPQLHQLVLSTTLAILEFRTTLRVSMRPSRTYVSKETVNINTCINHLILVFTPERISC